ncbi:MAG: hypothetical protein GF309_10255, partial [Candidatus Lokiarchaeota archaeon]|nr:hypothetical protein [Candidatus Lokiarchaeota archaeon]
MQDAANLEDPQSASKEYLSAAEKFSGYFPSKAKEAYERALYCALDARDIDFFERAIQPLLEDLSERNAHEYLFQTQEWLLDVAIDIRRYLPRYLDLVLQNCPAGAEGVKMGICSNVVSQTQEMTSISLAQQTVEIFREHLDETQLFNLSRESVRSNQPENPFFEPLMQEWHRIALDRREPDELIELAEYAPSREIGSILCEAAEAFLQKRELGKARDLMVRRLSMGPLESSESFPWEQLISAVINTHGPVIGHDCIEPLIDAAKDTDDDLFHQISIRLMDELVATKNYQSILNSSAILLGKGVITQAYLSDMIAISARTVCTIGDSVKVPSEDMWSALWQTLNLYEELFNQVEMILSEWTQKIVEAISHSAAISRKWREFLLDSMKLDVKVRNEPAYVVETGMDVFDDLSREQPGEGIEFLMAVHDLISGLAESNDVQKLLEEGAKLIHTNHVLASESRIAWLQQGIQSVSDSDLEARVEYISYRQELNSENFQSAMEHLKKLTRITNISDSVKEEISSDLLSRAIEKIRKTHLTHAEEIDLLFALIEYLNWDSKERFLNGIRKLNPYVISSWDEKSISKWLEKCESISSNDDELQRDFHSLLTENTHDFVVGNNLQMAIHLVRNLPSTYQDSETEELIREISRGLKRVEVDETKVSEFFHLIRLISSKYSEVIHRNEAIREKLADQFRVVLEQHESLSPEYLENYAQTGGVLLSGKEFAEWVSIVVSCISNEVFASMLMDVTMDKVKRFSETYDVSFLTEVPKVSSLILEKMPNEDDREKYSVDIHTAVKKALLGESIPKKHAEHFLESILSWTDKSKIINSLLPGIRSSLSKLIRTIGASLLRAESKQAERMLSNLLSTVEMLDDSPCSDYVVELYKLTDSKPTIH